MKGVYKWYLAQQGHMMAHLSEQEQSAIMKSQRQTFSNLLKASDIKNVAEPLSYLYSDDELCLTNPYSRITCFLIYLYSLEFGSPTLYAELSRAAL